MSRRSGRPRSGRAIGKPALRLALTVRWRSAELDQRLAAGEDPWASDALSLRAGRLTGRRIRRQAAAGLAGALRSAHSARRGFTAAVCPPAPDVLEAEAVIAAIGRRLRGTAPVDPRGVAMIRLLLIDGNSVLYCPGEPGALGSRLRAAAAALEPLR